MRGCLRLLSEPTAERPARPITHLPSARAAPPATTPPRENLGPARHSTQRPTVKHTMSDATAVPDRALSPTLASDLLNKFPALRAAPPSAQPVASTSTLPLSPSATVKELGVGLSKGGRKRGRADEELEELLETEEREQQQLIGHFNQVSTYSRPSLG